MTKTYAEMATEEQAARVAEIEAERAKAGLKNALFTVVRQYAVVDNKDGSQSARFRLVTYVDHKPVYVTASAYLRPDHAKQADYFAGMTQGSRWTIDYKESQAGFIDIYTAFPRPRKTTAA